MSPEEIPARITAHSRASLLNLRTNRTTFEEVPTESILETTCFNQIPLAVHWWTKT